MIRVADLRKSRTDLLPVPLSEREGVFVHSFQCNACALHFNVFSWKADRHTAASITCPECGQHEGCFRHSRAVLNENTAFGSGGPGSEIYQHCPWPGSALMDDSTMRGLDKLYPPETED